MSRYHGLQGKSVEHKLAVLLTVIGISWSIGFYVLGWLDRAAGRDATSSFTACYLPMILWSGLPARWWRYTLSFPRTLLHGLVWSYLFQYPIIMVCALASFAGVRDLSGTALPLLVPYCLLLNVAMWWLQRTPAPLRA